MHVCVHTRMVVEYQIMVVEYFRGGLSALGRILAPKIFPSADVFFGRSNPMQLAVF